MASDGPADAPAHKPGFHGYCSGDPGTATILLWDSGCSALKLGDMGRHAEGGSLAPKGLACSAGHFLPRGLVYLSLNRECDPSSQGEERRP